MDQHQWEMEQSVWQRVHAQTQEPQTPERLGAILLMLRENQGDYRILAKGTYGRQVLRLMQMERTQSIRLQGLCRMLGQPVPSWKEPKAEQTDPKIRLRRCYLRSIRCLRALEKWEEDSQFGYVFAEMAEQKRVQCNRILEMLGWMGRRQTENG